MRCLVQSFSLFTGLDVEAEIGHAAPHHIQEVIETIGDRFSITEISSADIDPDCPFGPERIDHWAQNHSGVLTYWSGEDTLHAVTWYHKSKTVFNGDLPLVYTPPYNIFWIVEPRWAKLDK